MAKDFIMRDDVVNVIDRTNTFTFSRERTIEKLRAIPAADVAPVVRGRWIDKNAGNATCSVCKRRHKDVYDDDASDSFCRSCGADMREVQHDD